MHKHAEPTSIRSPRAPRLGLVASLLLALFFAPALLRSQTMPTSPASSLPELTQHERLMRLVPEQVGEWKRQSLNRARPRIDGVRPPTVLAEFRRGKHRVQLSVTQSAPVSLPAPSAPIERDTDEGSEKIYVEGNAIVHETRRVGGGQTDVNLSRADGIVVVAHSIGVAASELKAIALGVKAAAR